MRRYVETLRGIQHTSHHGSDAFCMCFTETWDSSCVNKLGMPVLWKATKIASWIFRCRGLFTCMHMNAPVDLVNVTVLQISRDAFTKATKLILALPYFNLLGIQEPSLFLHKAHYSHRVVQQFDLQMTIFCIWVKKGTYMSVQSQRSVCPTTRGFVLCRILEAVSKCKDLKVCQLHARVGSMRQYGLNLLPQNLHVLHYAPIVWSRPGDLTRFEKLRSLSLHLTHFRCKSQIEEVHCCFSSPNCSNLVGGIWRREIIKAALFQCDIWIQDNIVLNYRAALYSLVKKFAMQHKDEIDCADWEFGSTEGAQIAE